MKRILYALVALAAVASAACRQYDVDVYKNFNRWVLASEGVTESFTNTADSLLWAEFFVGAANSGGQYQFDITDGPNGSVLYRKLVDCHAESSYRYVRAYLTPLTDQPLTKGKEYVLKVTHSDGDSINYYASNLDEYQYGEIEVPEKVVPDVWDLACRIEGINRPVSRESLSSDIDVTPKCH